MYLGTATDCTFIGNEVLQTGTPEGLGGGAAEAVLVRCVLVGNVAQYGGGLWSGTATNCTFYGNVARVDGGATSAAVGVVTGEQGVLILNSSIFWANSPNELAGPSGSVSVAYCDVKGGYTGIGNLQGDPKFWGAEIANLRLRAGSPCIDAGDPNLALDADGTRADVGALPFELAYTLLPFSYCDGKLSSEGCIPLIGYTGLPNMTGPDDFFVTGDSLVKQKPTVLIWSRSSASTPFSGATLCLAPPIYRTPVTDSGGFLPCGGVGNFSFSQSYMTSKGLIAGDQVFAQFWQRDPAHMDGTGVGLSNALGFTLGL